jgi:hypothetical protein
MLVDVASIGVLTFFIYFVIEKKNIFLITLICIIGVLVKETLVLLGFTASLLIFKQAKKKIILIFITFLPILIQLLFRIFIKVPSPPSISEIYQFNDVSKPLIDLIASLGFLSVLLIGLILEKKYIILSLPTFLLITVINSSDLADGIRIWYTVIPLLFLGYGVIVKKCSIIQVNRVCSEHL